MFYMKLFVLNSCIDRLKLVWSSYILNEIIFDWYMQKAKSETSGDRTHDQMVKSHSLYLLSYSSSCYLEHLFTISRDQISRSQKIYSSQRDDERCMQVMAASDLGKKEWQQWDSNPRPWRTSAWSWRLRPLGHIVFANDLRYASCLNDRVVGRAQNI